MQVFPASTHITVFSSPTRQTRGQTQTQTSQSQTRQTRGQTQTQTSQSQTSKERGQTQTGQEIFCSNSSPILMSTYIKHIFSSYDFKFKIF